MRFKKELRAVDTNAKLGKFDRKMFSIGMCLRLLQARNLAHYSHTPSIRDKPEGCQ